jgi:hypothetical protein
VHGAADSVSIKRQYISWLAGRLSIFKEQSVSLSWYYYTAVLKYWVETSTNLITAGGGWPVWFYTALKYPTA